MTNRAHLLRHLECCRSYQCHPNVVDFADALKAAVTTRHGRKLAQDVNVLVAAFPADHKHRDTAYGWLIEARQLCAQGGEKLTPLPMIATAFLPLVTGRWIFSDLDSIEE